MKGPGGMLGVAWRFVAVILAFVLFGIVGVLFQLLLRPMMHPAPGRIRVSQMRARRIVSASWRFLIGYLRFARVISVRMEGFERLGRPGQLVLANHPSLLDVLFLVGHVPGMNCVVKADLLGNPAMVAPIRACGFVLNDVSASVLEASDAVLKEGQTLLVFPEGTRTGEDGVIRLNRGAVSIGLRSAAFMTPVVVEMKPSGLKKGQPWYKIPLHKYRYELRVGADIDPRDWLAEKPLPIASRRLNDHLQDYFARELSHERPQAGHQDADHRQPQS